MMSRNERLLYLVLYIVLYIMPPMMIATMVMVAAGMVATVLVGLPWRRKQCLLLL